MSLMKKLKTNTTVAESSLLSESIYFSNVSYTPTDIAMLNVALSGKIDGGITSGITMWAGPSKNFKSLFSLVLAKAYMDKHPDSILLFYDSEFGTPIKYFQTLNIDMGRVLHTPIINVETLKFDIMAQLEQIDRGDHLIIIIDSLGNLASKKEVDDTMEQKSVADMSRAKQNKSLFRMVTPHLAMKDIPLIVVNHTYKTMEMFSRDVVGGGTGSYYSSSSIFIMGRQQEKDKDGLLGYNFVINVEKSRFVKEKSKILITVKFDGGIEIYSGLAEVALEGGFIQNANVGRSGGYARIDRETGELCEPVKVADSFTKEFWRPLLENAEFKSYVEKKYSLAFDNIMPTAATTEEQIKRKGKK